MKVPPGVQIKVKIKEKLQTARTQKRNEQKEEEEKKKEPGKRKNETTRRRGKGQKKMRAAEEIKGNIFEWCFMLQKSKKDIHIHIHPFYFYVSLSQVNIYWSLYDTFS